MNLKLEMIHVNLIDVDERVQNKVDMNRVKKIDKLFNIHAFGALSVSKRGSRYHCTDGFHRLEVAKKRGFEKVPCVVSENLTLEEEGWAYLIPKESQKKPRALDNFRVRLNIGDEDAKIIENIIKSCGSYINFNGSGSTKGIRAIGACESVYKTHGANSLKKTLEVLFDTWGSENAYSTAINGMARFLTLYYHDENFSFNELKNKLKRVDLDQIRREVTSESKNFGTSANISFAKIIARYYNKGKSSRKLSDKFN